MTFINYAAREINCKIVYYGPGLGGKTTNLQHIYEKTRPESRGTLLSLATQTERDLPTALPADEMYRRLNIKGEPTFEATASNGAGVFETLKASARQVLTELRKK